MKYVYEKKQCAHRSQSTEPDSPTHLNRTISDNIIGTSNMVIEFLALIMFIGMNNHPYTITLLFML